MQKINLISAAIGVVFAVLGLTKNLSYDISLTVMNVCLGISCLSRAVIEFRIGKKNSAFLDFLLGALFLAMVAVRLWR